MTQAALFDLNVRASDPVTSHVAAKVERSTLRARVRQMLEQHPTGLTDWELTTLLGEPDRRKPSVAKRRQESGAVESGRTRKSPDGLPCVVWVLDATASRGCAAGSVGAPGGVQ